MAAPMWLPCQGRRHERAVGEAMSSVAIAGLPAPLAEPLDAAAAFAGMSRAERSLAEEVLGGEEVLFVVRSGSRVDVGGWLGPARLWVLALRHGLALVAHGPRPYAERILFSELQGSTYNPVTGELVLAPARAPGLHGIRMTPLEAYQALAQIFQERPGNVAVAD